MDAIFKLIVALGFSFAFIVMLSLGSHNCYEAYSCAGTSISGTSGAINCYGYYSCGQSTSLSTTGANIYCFGSYSCHECEIIKHASTKSTISSANINCDGLFSCASVTTLYNEKGNIYCRGEQSCLSSNIFVEYASSEVGCGGEKSCAKALIRNEGSVYFDGHLSGQNAIIYTNPNNSDITETYYYFRGTAS